MTIWRKSSFCGSGGTDDCVEVADLGGHVGMRDSKAPEAGHLVLTPEAFGQLVNCLKQDDRDF
ncbi:DUF397 domain-containing protein [Actinomadura luteofluorescens]